MLPDGDEALACLTRMSFSALLSYFFFYLMNFFKDECKQEERPTCPT